MIDVLINQLTDVFRAGLIIALIATTIRNQAVTGTWVPLAAGMIFIAVIIPVTLQTGSPVPMIQAIGVGLVANLILLAIGMAAWQIIRRISGK